MDVTGFGFRVFFGSMPNGVAVVTAAVRGGEAQDFPAGAVSAVRARPALLPKGRPGRAEQIGIGVRVGVRVEVCGRPLRYRRAASGAGGSAVEPAARA